LQHFYNEFQKAATALSLGSRADLQAKVIQMEEARLAHTERLREKDEQHRQAMFTAQVQNVQTMAQADAAVRTAENKAAKASIDAEARVAQVETHAERVFTEARFSNEE